ncbi:MAG: glucosamine-6-phosphate synthase, partial [Planctomycetes bacterium]|nr:glucosamine-6-phosphate synthase [Planctomycetota bacterium]
MCGIIAVLRRRARRPSPLRGKIEECLARTGELSNQPPTDGLLEQLRATADALRTCEELLRGAPGAALLVRDRELAQAVQARVGALQTTVTELERAIDDHARSAPGQLEALNAALISVKDLAWTLGRDRVGTAEMILTLGGDGLSDAAIESYHSIALALAALDRMEVRGRDSAGVQVLVTGHCLDLEAPEVRELLQPGITNRLFTDGAVRTPDGHLVFVYKAAAEIGELGDNGRALRLAIREDVLLRMALSGHDAEASVLGHTRWASVGIISQANAHPINHEETGRDGPFVSAVLNGDVDNFLELSEANGMSIAPEITTDTKVIPTLVS